MILSKKIDQYLSLSFEISQILNAGSQNFGSIIFTKSLGLGFDRNADLIKFDGKTI